MIHRRARHLDLDARLRHARPQRRQDVALHLHVALGPAEGQIVFAFRLDVEGFDGLEFLVQRVVFLKRDLVVGPQPGLQSHQRGIQLAAQLVHGPLQAQDVGMVFADHAGVEHQLQADLAVDQRLPDRHQGGILHDVGRRLHQLGAVQVFQLLQPCLAHQHLHPGGAAFALEHVQPRGLHPDAHSHPADQRNAPLFADALQFGLRLLHPLLLLAHLVADGVNGPLDFPPLGVQPPVPVHVGDLVGDLRRALRILGRDPDVHQHRVAVLLHPKAPGQNLQRQVDRDRRFVLVEFRAPHPLQVQPADHLRQHRTRAHDLLLRHQEERIVPHPGGLPVVERIHVHGVLADLQLRGRRELLGHHQRVGRARHDGQQRHRQDDLLAVADHPPVIKKMEGRGLVVFCHGVSS
jgi:predicted small lipoprotein YifL